MKKIHISIIILLQTVILISCSKDDNPEVINEEEVITTMNVTLTNGLQTITLQSLDLDGDGPDEPVVTVSGNLSANTTYTGTIELLNQTESPAEDITAEVEEENTEHQFFYILTGAIAGTEYLDTDDNGNPLGIQFSVTTGAAGTGTLTIYLIHQPDKYATGVSSGDKTNAGGETDFQATFPITVE